MIKSITLGQKPEETSDDLQSTACDLLLMEFHTKVNAKDEAGCLEFIASLDVDRDEEDVDQYVDAQTLWTHSSVLTRTIYLDLVRFGMYTVLHRLVQSCDPQLSNGEIDICMVLIALDAHDEQYALSMLDVCDFQTTRSADDDEEEVLEMIGSLRSLGLAILEKATEQKYDSVSLKTYHLLSSVTMDRNIAKKQQQPVETMREAIRSESNYIICNTESRKRKPITTTTTSQNHIVQHKGAFARMCELGCVPVIQAMIQDIQKLLNDWFMQVKCIFDDDVPQMFRSLLQHEQSSFCYTLIDIMHTLRKQLRLNGNEWNREVLLKVFQCVTCSEDVKLLEYMLQRLPINPNSEYDHWFSKVYSASTPEVKVVLHKYFESPDQYFQMAKFGKPIHIEQI